MSDEQPHMDHEPPTDPAAADILGYFAILDIPDTDRVDLPMGLIAALCDLSESTAAAVLEDLRRSNVLSSVRPNWYRLTEARVGIRPELSGADAVVGSRRARLVAHVSQTITAAQPSKAIGWVDSHRLILLRTITMATSAGLHPQAGHLAELSWQVTSVAPTLRTDTQWRSDLARRGEDAAIEGRDPDLLGRLLEHSAQLAEQFGERDVGEAQWVRALAVWRRLDNHAGVVRVLVALRELYRSWGRLHRALDACFELVTVHQRRGDDRGLALALTEVGITMLAADRPDAAVDYLTRANTAWEATAVPVPSAQAGTLLALGRAHWRQDAWGLARRRFSDALALWVDVDEIQAERVRRLLSHPDGDPLPEDS